ncbi:hypothetical protein [Scytonema sp. PRP1]|uniref:hypothetical protein n=1 Tax=Scytonema sp. PRP1 TaxID=3120513 RepID=UPI002FD71A41
MIFGSPYPNTPISDQPLTEFVLQRAVELVLIEKHKITRIHVVPPILLALAKQPIVDKYNLSSLRVLTSAAAPLWFIVHT